MSKLFCHGQPDSGMLVLQHKGFNRREASGLPAFDLDLRGMVSAVRVTGRHERGHWRVEEDTAGDVLGGAHWPAASRSIPAWSFAWPVVAIKGAGTQDVATGQGQCAIAPEPMYLPIYGDGKPDTRFQPKTMKTPEGWGDIKFPADFVGISLMATQEEEQVDLFFPSDPRLIAVHRKGDARMGTVVTDMGDDFKIDPERNVRLQSIFRPLKQPLGGSNSIALNFAPSGCGDTFNGFFFDFSADPDKPGIIGTMHSAAGGPLVAGHPTRDKHRIGEDADGVSVNQGHLWLRSKFYWNENEDGPLRYDGIYDKDAANFPKPEVGIQQTPYQADTFFQYDSNIEEFRWSSGTFIYNTTTPAKVKTTEPTRQDVATGTGGSLDSSAPPGDRASGYGLTPVATGTSAAPIESNEPPPPPPPPKKSDSKSTATNIVFERTTAQLIPHMSGTRLYRPIMQGTAGFVDMGKWENQTEEKIKQYDKKTPVTFKTVPFGKQISGGFQRKQSSPNSRYSGGTGLGGIAVIPPEADITDTYGTTCECHPPTVTASGKPISNPTLMINTGAFISTGQVSTTLGGVVNGHRTWGTCTGLQITEAINSAGTPLLAGTGVWEDGALLLRWQGTEGCDETAICVDHKVIPPNTNAEYEWTFQARDGTIALQDGATLSNGAIPYSNNGLLDDNSAMSYDSVSGDLTVPGGITLGGNFQAANIIGTTSVTSPAIRVGTAGTYNTIDVSGSGETATLPAITGTLGVVSPSPTAKAIFYAGSTVGQLDNDVALLSWDDTAATPNLRVGHNFAYNQATMEVRVFSGAATSPAAWFSHDNYNAGQVAETVLVNNTSSTVDTGVSVALQQRATGSVYTVYSRLTNRIRGRTAGSEYGEVSLETINNGTMQTVYAVNELADTHVWSLGGSELMRLDTTRLSLDGDTDTGWRFSGANEQAWDISGSLKMVLNANTLGVGRAAPDANAVIEAYKTDEANILVKSTNANSRAFVRLSNDNYTWEFQNEGATGDSFDLRDGSTGDIRLSFVPQSETVFNQNGVDRDTRFEGTSRPNLLVVDAGGDFVKTDGGRRKRVDRLTSNTTVDSTYHIVFGDTDGGAFTVTLPASPTSGDEFVIKNTGGSGNNLTVGRNGNNIEGAASDLTLGDGDSRTFVFETTEGWRLI